MSAIVQGVRNFGPYMLVELLLPGGTLIALTMWLLARRRKKLSLAPAAGTKAAPRKWF